MRTPHRAATALIALIGLTMAGCAASDDAIQDEAISQLETTSQDAVASDRAVADTLAGVTADVRSDPG